MNDIYDVWATYGSKIVELMASDISKIRNFDIEKIKIPKAIDFLGKEYKKRGTLQKIERIERYYPDNVNPGKPQVPVLGTAIVIYTSMLMNLYIIGRITKSYNKNVVVIAGINHINYLNDFLKNVGWEKDIESKKISPKRVLIPNILISGEEADIETIEIKTLKKKRYRKTKTRISSRNSSNTKKRNYTKRV